MTPPDLPTPGSPSPRRPILSALITILLSLSAATYTGYHLFLVFQDQDTNHLETPLALAVSAQLQNGPSTLYGPFSGDHPEVLIHAPLYYRLAALLAWFLTLFGVDSIPASFASGRLLSVLGLILTLIAAYRLGRAGGLDPSAGLWSALLVASSPVLGGLPVTVRSDMLAIGLQTWGFSLILRIVADSRFDRRLILAFSAFGLALCMKQHALPLPALASAWLVVERVRKRVSFRLAALALAVCACEVLLYYGLEDLLTSGQMHESAILVPARLRSVTWGGWEHARWVLFEVFKLAIGLIGLTIALLFTAPRRLWLDRLDALLALALLAEIALAILLCFGSMGAWVNYFAPSAVLASVLLARALLRAVRAPGSLFRRGVLVLALLALWARDVDLVRKSILNRQDAQNLLLLVLNDPSLAGLEPRQIFFVGYPDRNRRFGNIKLAHDEWLYDKFERLGSAQPRSRWLRPALEHGPIRAVIIEADGRRDTGRVQGVEPRLPDLGYVLVRQLAGTCVWIRQDPSEPSDLPGK